MRVAILGCGQLARMLAQAAARLEVDCIFVAMDDESVDCVSALGPIVRFQAGDDVGALYRSLEEPAVVTVERESIDVELMRALQAFCPVFPGPDSVRCCQNRALERELLDELAIPCAPHRVAASPEALRQAVEALGLPLVVKATEAGYDGKLQWRLRTAADVEALYSEPFPGQCLVERWIEFEREVSLVAVRGRDGVFRAYPLTENLHRDGVLLASIVPARGAGAPLQSVAEAHVRAIMEHLGYVGVMAVEFFVEDGDLLVNELAPRVHNSGHWTMDGAVTGQFENHLRALLGMSLGDTGAPSPAGMLNLLGLTCNAAPPLPAGVETVCHEYNKTPAPGRKMGHINVRADSEEQLLQCLAQLHRVVYGDGNAALEIAAGHQARAI